MRLSALLGPQVLPDLPPAALGSRLQALAAQSTAAHRVPEALAVLGELARHGAAQALREILGRDLDPEVWPQAFEAMWLAACVDDAQAQGTMGVGLFGREQDRLERDLLSLEDDLAGATAEAVLARHAVRVLQSLRDHPEQAACVRREARGGQLGPTGLLAAAPDVLLALFPCWLASPFALGPLTDGEAGRFDAALFDESSQMPVETAVPALWRAGAVVVAGDVHQLPPPAMGAGPAQSVLEAAAFLPAYRLGLHYRSRDEALFSFANRGLYGGGVVTCAGPCGHGAGIEHLRVGSQARGGTGGAEARAVVKLVLREAGQRPDASIGVVTLGEDHASRILAALQAAARRDARLRDMLAATAGEPLFVKHVDIAQGDERDTVILALGLSPRDSGGAWPGLMQGELGRRRLSVATTRARARMIVVSSFGPEDLAADESRDSGPALLRDFLRYVAMRHGGAMSAQLSDEPVNPLEEELEAYPQEVYSALQGAGLDVAPQYGALRHRLDLAVRRSAGEPFALAIACDGAERHEAASRRALDRQRQLELLGWRWHRIWAGDWAADREGEIRRVLDLLPEAPAKPVRL